MSAITLPVRRPIDVVRLLFLGGLMAALATVAAADIRKECGTGAFSAGFSRGFDVGHCKLVVSVAGTTLATWAD